MIGFDEAVGIVADKARPLGSERVSIADARGRILAGEIRAVVSAPPCDVSAMDGYAVCDADLKTVPARLRVVGESFAGRGHRGRIGAGECVRVFTGAPIPAGADRVVVQEVVRLDHGEALFDTAPDAARHIRGCGSDFNRGDLLLPAGRLLDYRALVAAAGADLAEVAAWRRARTMLLGTGDELAEPGTAHGSADRIPESVSFGVMALAQDWGAQPVARRRLPDDLPLMEHAAAEAVDMADLVVVTGGASVGEKDYARAMFAPSGLELFFSKVAIKPGKPVWFGKAGKALVLGLPGNPTSALVTARLFLAPLVAGLTGRDPAEALRWRALPLASPLAPTGNRETFVRAHWTGAAAEPMSNQDSSAQKTLADSGLLLRRLAGAPAAHAGDQVEALDL